MILISFCLLSLLLITTSGYLVDIDGLPDSLWFEKAYKPTQIHIAFGETTSDISVTWVTSGKSPKSKVLYGAQGLTEEAVGSQTLFVDQGKQRRKFYIHRTFLFNLLENTTYEYKCGCDSYWSETYKFHIPPKDTNAPITLGIYGDFGVVNDISLPLLRKEVNANKYDAFFHIGDIAYDMHDDDGKVGDQFMENIQSIAARVPYMVAPGNHERAYNYLHYRKRFTMPGGTEGQHYSINLGPIHFVIFSSEVYYDGFCNIDGKHQYFWLKNDLKAAASPKNRNERPWIIVMGHRPMYCSTEDADDCRNVFDSVRVGCQPNHKYGLEDLFRKYSVDIAMFGHEHTYERSWPLYNYTVFNGSSGNPYHNAEAMIHIISGAAGCQEKVDKFHYPPQEWSAFRTNDYSYTRLNIYNKTHLYFEQVSADKNGTVDDHFWVTKDLGWVYPVNAKKLLVQ